MKKLMNKKGFTLMEMLIVVAIIVILVAISIPTFSSQLDNAKQATDKANLRAAKGVAQTVDMTGSWAQFGAADNEEEEVLYYNIEAGKFQESEITTGYGQSSAYSDQVITVTVKKGAMEGEPDWTPVSADDGE